MTQWLRRRTFIQWSPVQFPLVPVWAMRVANGRDPAKNRSRAPEEFYFTREHLQPLEEGVHDVKRVLLPRQPLYAKIPPVCLSVCLFVSNYVWKVMDAATSLRREIGNAYWSRKHIPCSSVISSGCQVVCFSCSNDTATTKSRKTTQAFSRDRSA